MTKRIKRPEFRVLDGVAEANQAKAKVALSVVAFTTKNITNPEKQHKDSFHQRRAGRGWNWLNIDSTWLRGLLVDNQLEEASESKHLSPALFWHNGEGLHSSKTSPMTNETRKTFSRSKYVHIVI